MITFKNYDIVFFGLPDGDMMQCDLKVFKGENDVSDEFDKSGMINPTSENLYNILYTIDQADKPKKKSLFTSLMSFGKK